MSIFNKIKIKFDKKGFSLIETILYLAIVAILLVAVVSFNLTLSGTTSKLGANIKTSQNRRTTLGAIDYLTRNADGLLKDVNAYCTTSTTLALFFASDDYLPGTCVETSGGVKISTTNNRVRLDCYPNIALNGQYQACETSIGNSYYLSSPDVSIASSGLVFSTSTATSTASGFMNVNTYLTFTNLANNQTELLSTSTATSTVTLRNSQPDGLVAWWKFNDNDITPAVDSIGAHNGSCHVTKNGQTPLVNGSTYSFDFEYTDSASCDVDNADILNMSGGFTIATWINAESSIGGGAYDYILSKQDVTAYQGYAMWLKDKYLYCGICDGASCVEKQETNASMTLGATYHVACTYDPGNDQMTLYIFEEGVGGVGTTTAAITETLVNLDDSLYIATNDYVSGDYFDGFLDELRLYNRVLSAQEIWALQSQGADAN